MSTTEMQRYIAQVGDLPSVPAVASAVLQVTADPNASAESLRAVIDRDPALCARILKVANSSLYSFSREIETVQHAIALLGFRTVTSIVLAASLREVFTHFGLAEKQIWEHSTICGAVAARLASYGPVDVDRDDAFTAGLLHDLGKIALNNTARKRYTTVLSRVYNEGLSFVEAERDELGFDHAELGAAVAAKWKLSRSLENAIRYHHDPEGAARRTESDRRLTALTSVVTASCTRLGVGRRGPVESLDLGSLWSWSMLGLTEDDIERVLEIVGEEVKHAEGLFG